MKAAILGVAGPTISERERAFFREAQPAGYILFKRNCVDRLQLQRLTSDLRSLGGRENLPILMDQEGGRVARMQPPEWPAFPPAEMFDRLYELAPISAIEAAMANATALARMIREVGINVDALPVLDVRRSEGHDVIGDRALGADPMRVAALGRAVLDGLKAGGAVGIVKHMPGHGRATADSHHELPVVEATTDELARDLAPFSRLNWAPMAMTAHVIYPAWDADRCASLSPTIIGTVIRGQIGFDGLLMSDDVGMNALSGSFATRAAGVIAAGCDVALHCSGDLAEMAAVIGAVPALGTKAAARLARAMATIADEADGPSFADAIAQRDGLLGLLPS